MLGEKFQNNEEQRASEKNTRNSNWWKLDDFVAAFLYCASWIVLERRINVMRTGNEKLCSFSGFYPPPQAKLCLVLAQISFSPTSFQIFMGRIPLIGDSISVGPPIVRFHDLSYRLRLFVVVLQTRRSASAGNLCGIRDFRFKRMASASFAVNLDSRTLFRRKRIINAAGRQPVCNGFLGGCEAQRDDHVEHIRSGEWSFFSDSFSGGVSVCSRI